jgi:predicted ribosome quality control (RQC) complex YloA/Tae2 family protein
MNGARPWTDTVILARVLERWRGLYSGRELFRTSAGPGWIRLHLAGDDRVSLLLSGITAARLICRIEGKLPAPLAKALPVARQHPLHQLLDGARLISCGLLPDDRVVAFHLQRDQAVDFVLLHRLFGARANSTLVDRKRHLLWSVQRPPHHALADWPPAATWTGGDGDSPPATYDAQAVDHMARACAEQLHTGDTAALVRRRKMADRLLANLNRDLANADQGDLHRRKAEALAANLHTLRQGAPEVELADLTDGTPLKIALDPALTPAANMEAWFRRARKAAKGLEIIRTRRDEAATRGDHLVRAAARLTIAAAPAATELDRLANLQEWRAEFSDLFERRQQQRRTHAPDEPARPFRRYLVDGTWEVWVGRNNKENDELTHRAAHNRDLWLHAQGVAGSHVILRTGGRPETVPRAVLFKAAALAALYSKARHAQIVPVIHTEKRYVRKPRKSPAGTAVCLRDQSLFVEPGVMKGVEPA